MRILLAMMGFGTFIIADLAAHDFPDFTTYFETRGDCEKLR
jgi:hypothetical protein